MANPTVFVAPPRRRPRKGGIRAVANVESFERGFAAEALDWVNNECVFPEDAPGLCWGTEVPDGEKNRYGFDIGGSSPIFALYGGAECFAEAGETYEQAARENLAAGSDRVVEGKLAEWLDGQAPIPVAHTSWAEAIADAEQGADDGYLGMPVLVISRGDAVLASAAGALDGPDQGDGVMWTPNGTPVLASGSVSRGTFYMTGDLTFYESAVVASTAPDFRHNRQMAIAEQAFAFAVDCGYVQSYSVDTTP